ncbi:minor capsid protein [Fructilactobacillus sp. Tb1]|uniref:minor capsid protein n=1 Tax=Fructilactobacillus sp. Tb1 TaxID=3422304 RepID=UPI003D2AB1F6
MKNDDYWKKRESEERAWIAKNIKNDKDFDKILAQHYNKLTDDIMDRINKEYINLGKNNGYTMADAKAKVKSVDIVKFENEAKSLVKQAHDIYKKNGKVSYADFTDEVNARMRLYNATMRINRLEMLKAQIGQDIVQSGINVNNEINNKLKSDALAEYTRQAGILGKNKAKPDVKELTKIISAQTGDVTFSSRIWQDQSALKAELDVLLTRQMVRGISPIEIARDLRKQVSDKVSNSKYAAERIARTESARVQTQVQLASFTKYDINYCHWIAEPTACQICTDISENNDGLGEGIYSTTEVPYLPAHPNCRCSLSAYVPDESQLEAKGFNNSSFINLIWTFTALEYLNNLINE